MTTSNFPLHHIARPPQAPAERAPLLVLLHGYGSNEHDLLGLAPYLDRRLYLLSARAPHTLMTDSYAWFAIDIAHGGIRMDPAQVIASIEQVIRLVEQAAAAYPVDPARVYLLGFSQGAILSALVTLLRPDLVAGAVLMSGGVPARELLPALSAEQVAGKPFLMVHGVYDPVLPVDHGRAGRDLLQELGVDLTYREFPMAHEVSLDSLREVSAWLSQRLGA